MGLTDDHAPPVPDSRRRCRSGRSNVGQGGLPPEDCHGRPPAHHSIERPTSIRTTETSRIEPCIPLPGVVADALAFHLHRYGPGLDGLIFTNDRGLPIRRNSFTPIFRRSADQVGIAAGDGFHELRHHYASLLISSGCSVTVVQRRLGHATAQETLDTYSHLWPDDDQRTTEAVDSLLGPALLLNPGAIAASENV